MMKEIAVTIKRKLSEMKKQKNRNTYTATYRIIEIIKDENDDYTVHVQLIGKSINFYANPEDILADDNLVNKFPPTDIRTLTYLGYLGINAPKYKILAKRFLDNNQVAFAVKKKGEKEATLKTVKEILNEQDILASMHPNDAQTVGYMVASENFENDRKKGF